MEIYLNTQKILKQEIQTEFKELTNKTTDSFLKEIPISKEPIKLTKAEPIRSKTNNFKIKRNPSQINNKTKLNQIEKRKNILENLLKQK